MARRAPAAAAQEVDQEVSLAAIRVGDLNMRSQMSESELTDLATSMSQLGLINAIQVIPAADGYDLVAGHRRCAAAEMLGWSTIRARVLSSDPLQAAAIAWSENHAREGVTIMDQARWIRAMMDRTHANQATTANLLGMSPSHLSEVLATLTYPEELQEALACGAVNHGVARAFARISDDAARSYYLSQALEHGASVRVAEQWASYWKSGQLQTNGSTPPPDDELMPPQPATTYLHTCGVCGQPVDGAPVLVMTCGGCAHTIRHGGAQ